MMGWYKRAYKGGGEHDWRYAVFREFRAMFGASDSIRVLYPGSYNHITASLLFKDVEYVDGVAKVGPAFASHAVVEYVAENKAYEREAAMNFTRANCESDMKFTDPAPFDALVSLSAGLVSPFCGEVL